MPWIEIAALADVPPGEVIEAMYEGEPYAVCNVSGEIRVLSGICPHAGGPLGQGAIENGVITCPFHAWEFDSSSGACTADETVSVPTFAVRVENGAVLADLPDPGGSAQHA